MRVVAALAFLAACGSDGGSPDLAVATDDAGVCTSGPAGDCSAACANYGKLFECLDMGGAGPDPAQCMDDCTRNVQLATDRARLYGCIEQFAGCAATLSCAQGCLHQPGGGCDPAGQTGSCLDGETCDARTKRCVATSPCATDSDCADGFACLFSPINGYCWRSCAANQGEPANVLCNASHWCDPATFTCVPWPCINGAASLDCAAGCARLAKDCASDPRCDPSICDQTKCMNDCAAAMSSGDPMQIAAAGCLQLGQTCPEFDSCIAICAPGIADAGVDGGI